MKPLVDNDAFVNNTKYHVNEQRAHRKTIDYEKVLPLRGFVAQCGPLFGHYVSQHIDDFVNNRAAFSKKIPRSKLTGYLFIPCFPM
jgi:hypothetical protein